MRDTLILCYHAVSPDWPAPLSVKPEAFARQLEFLSQAGYRGVTFTEAVQQRSRGRRVAVTFDDAYASVASLAKPILDRFGWPATVFAVSDFAVDGRPVLWEGVSRWEGTEHGHELTSLDWKGLRGLCRAGWEVGSHTVTHPRLTTVEDERLAFELEASRAAVEAAMGGPCPSIAYPYGDVDPRVVEAAAAAGYVTGAALPARWNQVAALEWPRVGVWHTDSMPRFLLKSTRLGRRTRGLLGR